MKWLSDYEDIIKSLGLESAPDHICNCDEMGLQDFSSRMVAEVGGPCFEVTAGEKGETTTCLASLNAAGGHDTTMIIFKFKLLKAEETGG